MSKITFDVLNAQQHCRLKAYFGLHNEQGRKSDFEKPVAEARQELRTKVVRKIQIQYDYGVEAGISLSSAVLRKETPFILHGHLQDDRYSIVFDGLKKVDGNSASGDFHYKPVIFSEARRVRKSERQLLAMFAVLLSHIQGLVPTSGFLYLGRNCAMTHIRIGCSRAHCSIGDLRREGRQDGKEPVGRRSRRRRQCERLTAFDRNSTDIRKLGPLYYTLFLIPGL